MGGYVKIWPSLGVKFPGILPIRKLCPTEVLGAYLRFRFHGDKFKGYGDMAP